MLADVFVKKNMSLEVLFADVLLTHRWAKLPDFEPLTYSRNLGNSRWMMTTVVINCDDHHFTIVIVIRYVIMILKWMFVICQLNSIFEKDIGEAVRVPT